MGKIYSSSEIRSMIDRAMTPREAKQKLLEMLVKFDDFCHKNDLTYYLSGGTLLGAIREHGFIPWDDDADIMMLREDYERLMTFNKINDDIDVVSIADDCGYYHPFPFIKLSDKETVSLIENSERNTGRGQFIDVFPLDGVPDDPSIKKRFFRRLSLMHKLRTIGVRKYVGAGDVYSILRNVLTFLFRPFSSMWFMKQIDKTAKQYSGLETKKIGLLCYTTRDLLIWNRCDFNGVRRVPYEDVFLDIPSRTEAILQHQFGDYMTPPLEKNRVPKHDVKMWWKHK